VFAPGRCRLELAADAAEMMGGPASPDDATGVKEHPAEAGLSQAKFHGNPARILEK